MASIRKEIETKARPDDAWAAIADIGALHTRLVPGFVVDTKLEPGARVVTFGNGMVVREPIVTIDGGPRGGSCGPPKAVERRITMRRSRCFRTPTKLLPSSGSPIFCRTP